MKKNLLFPLVIIGLFLITCGNEPPSEFYNGTPEDDSAIGDLLVAHPELLETDDMIISQSTPLILSAVLFPVVDSFFRVDSPIVKQHIDNLADSLTNKNRAQDLWYTKDTTCTVYLCDTFTIISEFHRDKKYTGHYDQPLLDTTMTIDTTTTPWETTYVFDTLSWVLKTIDVDSTGGYDSFENIIGDGLRHIFFEPKRDTVIEDGDTTYPIKEPHEWVLKRISYGSYYFPTKGAEYPYIDQVILTSATRTDTIFSYKTDTMFSGHAMNRFKVVDSLLEFTNGESINVEIAVDTFVVKQQNTLFLASCNGTRSQLIDGTGVIQISGSGITNLYFMVIHTDSYYYLSPRKDYLTDVWLVPVKVE